MIGRHPDHPSFYLWYGEHNLGTVQADFKNPLQLSGFVGYFWYGCGKNSKADGIPNTFDVDEAKDLLLAHVRNSKQFKELKQREKK